MFIFFYFLYAKLTNLTQELYLFDELFVFLVNKILQVVLIIFHNDAEELTHCKLL